MAEKHFTEQKRHAETYLIPFFRKQCPGFDNYRILEVGCAEGGFLDALSRQNIEAVGLELSHGRVGLAKSLNPQLNIRVGDITDSNTIWLFGGDFDLVVMRDVIEHIPDKKAAFRSIVKLLKPDGCLYITFPPRFSPFAGHHQNGRSVLRFIPYLHFLPKFLLGFLGKIFGEYPHIVENAADNFKLGLSIGNFERLSAAYGFRMIKEDLFISRPIYKTRFGIKPRRMADVPIVRELATVGCECLLKNE